MRRRSPTLLAATGLSVALLCGSAVAAPSPDLWATVNICDTAAHPNTIGIRASMPGNGTNERMYMRFEVQYFNREQNRFLPTGSRTRWVRVGSARYRSTQAGYSFHFDPPAAGQQFVMRGRVDFRWRARRGRPGHRRWVTVRKRRRYTRAGYLGVAGGDPPGRSEALCVIR